MRVNGQWYRTVWLEGSVVRMIDQRQLPFQFILMDCPTYRETAEAIRTMAIRGAGAIGAAAGYAMAQAALAASDELYAPAIEEAACVIRATRPTARDLFYAVNRVLEAARSTSDHVQARRAAVNAATQLADENAAAGERIGIVGEPLLSPGARVLTHCNAGWLAFADWGSALAPIYRAHHQGKTVSVYATETRPRGQGARLTAWELCQEGVPCTLVSDAACGSLFRRGMVDCVIVGADRIAENGDTANKIGTYTLALLAHQHHVPFYVAAPRSTFDLSTPSGDGIVIEERSGDEVHWVDGRAANGIIHRVRVTAEGTRVYNPAFDVTPAALVRAFITEGGLLSPQAASIATFVNGGAMRAAS